MIFQWNAQYIKLSIYFQPSSTKFELPYLSIHVAKVRSKGSNTFLNVKRYSLKLKKLS